MVQQVDIAHAGDDSAASKALGVPELLDEIMDALCDDRYALSRCSLVSCDWHVRARRRLFAKATLRSTIKDPYPATLDSRFQEIVDRDPTVSLYVKSLRLVHLTSFDGDYFDGDDLPIPWGDIDLAHLSHLSNVRSVTLSRAPCDTLIEVWRALIAVFPLMESLTFDRVELPRELIGDPPEPTWFPPGGRTPIRSFAKSERRPSPLMHISLINVSGGDGFLQPESFALAKALAAAGELSSLTSLHLSSPVGISYPWLSLFPALGHSLEHLSIAVNDIAVMPEPTGFYEGKSEPQLRECLVEFYAAVSSCPRLRTLCIKYVGMPTFARAMDENYEEPNPLISPFFLEQLSALLSRGTATPPFPHLHTLSFDLFATVESLALCVDAWRALFGTLTSAASGADGRTAHRYPQFRRVRVVFEEITQYTCLNRESKNWDEDERVAKGREMLRIVEDCGLELEVSAWESFACLM